MKPPVRARAAPRRFGVDFDKKWAELEPELEDWAAGEQRLLLRALKKQSAAREPDLGSLQAAVPGRSRQEIAAYLEGLRIRSVRSIVQRNCSQRLREKRQKQQLLRAPLQIWTELAEEATGKLDEVISAAFAQTLTIAATEPITRGNPRPKLTVQTSRAPGDGSGGTLPGDSHSKPGFSGLPPGNPVTELGPSSQEEPLDFDQIYKFLSAAMRNSPFPQLSPFESAVVLDLLMTLPNHLQSLNCPELWNHMNETYRRLNNTSSAWHGQSTLEHGCSSRLLVGPGPDPRSPQRPSYPLTDQPQDPGTSNQPGLSVQSLPAAQTDQSEHPHIPQSIQSQPEAKDGLDSDGPGPCPLNPFQLPIMLLVRGETVTSPQDHTADPRPTQCELLMSS